MKSSTERCKKLAWVLFVLFSISLAEMACAREPIRQQAPTASRESSETVAATQPIDPNHISPSGVQPTDPYLVIPPSHASSPGYYFGHGEPDTERAHSPDSGIDLSSSLVETGQGIGKGDVVVISPPPNAYPPKCTGPQTLACTAGSSECVNGDTFFPKGSNSYAQCHSSNGVCTGVSTICSVD